MKRNANMYFYFFLLALITFLLISFLAYYHNWYIQIHFPCYYLNISGNDCIVLSYSFTENATFELRTYMPMCTDTYSPTHAYTHQWFTPMNAYILICKHIITHMSTHTHEHTQTCVLTYTYKRMDMRKHIFSLGMSSLNFISQGSLFQMKNCC